MLLSRMCRRPTVVVVPWGRRLTGAATRCLTQDKATDDYDDVKAEKTRAISRERQPLAPRVKKPKSSLARAPSFKQVLESSDLTPFRKANWEAERFLRLTSRHVETADRPNEVNWEACMRAVREAEQRFPLRYYEPEELDDLQEKCITYNLAKVVNESPCLSKLVDLGVSLAEWEKAEKYKESWTDIALRLDFKKDVAPKVRLLADHLKPDSIGGLLTKNAPLLLEDVENLKTRIQYLQSKKFSAAMIRKILTANPYWLTYPAQEIDSRLAYFQKTFRLSGNEVRKLVGKLPLIITWGGTPGQIRLNNFTLKEVCGFKESEMKSMLLAHPLLFYQKQEKAISDMFQLLHNEVGYPHSILRKAPEVLVGDALALRPRLDFLRSLGRARFDPSQPLYVSPKDLVLTDEVEFCEAAAGGIPVEVYNEFLKTV